MEKSSIILKFVFHKPTSNLRWVCAVTPHFQKVSLLRPLFGAYQCPCPSLTSDRGGFTY